MNGPSAAVPAAKEAVPSRTNLEQSNPRLCHLV
jgi:hypothetical protein